MEDLVLQNIADVLRLSVADIDTSVSFIQLGGTSLSAVQLVKACREDGIAVLIGDLLDSAPIAQLLEKILPTEPEEPSTPSDHVDAMSTGVTTPTSSTSLPLPTTGHLTEMQLSFIAGSEKYRGGNIIAHYEEYYAEDIPALKRAWRLVVETEPIFRTTIDLGEDQGRLVEGKKARFEWREHVVTDEHDYDQKLSRQTSRSHVGTWFDVITLNTGNPEKNRSTIIWKVHHALMDGYSAYLLLGKVRRAALGESIKPGPSCIRVLNDIALYQEQNLERGKEFWSERNTSYADCVGDLMLPLPTTDAPVGTEIDLCVVKYDHSKLAAQALQAGVTMASIHHAAWTLLLATYLDSDSVVFGAVLSGRNLPVRNVEDVTSSLVNALPFHMRINRDLTSHEFLREVFNNLNSLADYQWTTSIHGVARQYSSLLAMQYDYKVPTERNISPLRMWSRTKSDMPLSILIEEDGNVCFQFNSMKFNRKSVCVMAECYVRICELLSSPASNIQQCLDQVIPERHREVLLRYGNCFSESTTPKSIVDDLLSLYEAAAESNPGATAVQRESQKLSYADMNATCNALAIEIMSRTKQNDVVCVYADQSVEWIVAIFAILKARCVYCPINTVSPADYVRSLYESSEAKLLIAPHKSPKLDGFTFVEQWLFMDDVRADDRTSGASFISRGSTDPTANAYLCFTSGSTGKPKGVMCTHEGLVAFQKDLTVRLLARPGWKISQVMSPAFDGSIHELFSALCYGATLVLPSSSDPFAHIYEVDSALLTPSVASVLDPSDFPKLTAVYLVGEPVPPRVANKWASQKQLYNMYGPTEATGGATISKLIPDQPVTIGGPNPSSRIYILNSRHQLCPPGVVGELFLAGVQVARGYINRPDETSKRFLKDNICPERDSMMYQTGDRGYWNEKGEVILLGRADRQIKLRGFRLDLNDLETRMVHAYSTVSAAAIVAVNAQLIAMVRPKEIDMGNYRKALENAMPRYAIPHHIIPVDEFPQTSNGKLDYKAIEKMPLTVHTTDKNVVSRVSEKRIATVWRDLLGLPDGTAIESESNFLDMGGHSLLQLLMAGRLSKLFGHTIPPVIVFESNSLHDLARSIEAIRQSQTQSSKKLKEAGPLGKYQVSPIELDWYHKYELDVSSSAFNVSLGYAFSAELVDRDRLTEAWNTVLRRHQILRTRYVKRRRGEVVRRYADNPPRVQRVANVNIWKETHRIFNVTSDDLVRVTISKDKMVIVASHIICDLTTIQILLQEVGSIYSGLPVAPTVHEYMDTSVWSSLAYPCDLDFWSEYLKDAPVLTSSPSRDDYRGSTALCQVPTHTFQEMTRLVQSNQFSYHQLALAAVALASQAESDKIDIVLGGPYLNRRSEQDMSTVGLFLEPLPIRIRYDPGAAASSYIDSVQEQSQAAVARAIPWNQLLESLQVTPDFPDHPLLDTMVTFHDERDRLDPLGVESMERLLIWTNGAKFKLMVEFTAVSHDSLLLRLEYDHACYSTADITRLQDLIVTSLLYLSLEVPYDKIKSHLRSISSGSTCTFYKQPPYGTRMGDI